MGNILFGSSTVVTSDMTSYMQNLALEVGGKALKRHQDLQVSLPLHYSFLFATAV